VKYLLPLLLSAVSLVSCSVPNPDLSNVKSIAVANGVGNRLNRVKIGTTVFNNTYEKTEVPGLASAMNESAVRNLKTRFNQVKTVSVATHSGSSLFGSTGQLDIPRFKKDAIAAGAQQGVDAVWAIYPGYYDSGRGTPINGIEQRCDSMLGMSREGMNCVVQGELLNTRTGETISRSIYALSGGNSTSAPWEKKFSSYPAATQKEIRNNAIQVAKKHMALSLNGAGVTTSKME